MLVLTRDSIIEQPLLFHMMLSTQFGDILQH